MKSIFQTQFAVQCYQLLKKLGPLQHYVRVFFCKRRYAKVLERLKNRPDGQKIRVLFLVNEPAKWKCQTVYDKMKASSCFEPFVCLSALSEQLYYSDDELEDHFRRAEKFFDSLGDAHYRAVTLNPRIYNDLREFKPDIVFFPEPWRMVGPQRPELISRFALTCYVPYYVPNYGDIELECKQQMHYFLYTYFSLSSFWSQYYQESLKQYDHVERFVDTGHPALDYFYHHFQEPTADGYVIYAPHYSFKCENDGLFFHYSTFLTRGMEMLEYAKEHPNIKWLFKPHPKLRTFLIETSQWTKDKVEWYYREWEKIAVSYFGGDYQDLFLRSRAMITDCASFLSEYGSTTRPIVHLIPDYIDKIPQAPSKVIFDTYYQVRENDSLKAVLDEVVLKNHDTKKVERLEALRKVGLWGVDAADNIVSYLKTLVERT